MQMVAVGNNVFRLILGKRFDFFLKLGHDIEVLRVVFTKHSKVTIKKWPCNVAVQYKHIAHLLRSRRALAGVPKKKGNFDRI